MNENTSGFIFCDTKIKGNNKRAGRAYPHHLGQIALDKPIYWSGKASEQIRKLFGYPKVISGSCLGSKNFPRAYEQEFTLIFI